METHCDPENFHEASLAFYTLDITTEALHWTSVLLESKCYINTENKSDLVQQGILFWESELVVAALSRKNSMLKEDRERGSARPCWKLRKFNLQTTNIPK